MSWFSLFKKKKVSYPYQFTDEDRELSKKVRDMKQQMQIREMELQLQNKELEMQLRNAEIKSRILDLMPDGDEADGIAEQLFSPILQSVLGGGLLKGDQTPLLKKSPQDIPPPSRTPLTEEQIREIKDSLPAGVKKYARSAPDAVIRTFALQQIPDLTEEELFRVVKIAHE